MDSKRFLEILGEKVRAVRKAKKFSQERLAELSGLHPTYISDIERGKVNASIYSFYMIVNALGISFSELVDMPASKIDGKFENEVAELVSLIRGLDKKKRIIFLSAVKGLMHGIEKY